LIRASAGEATPLGQKKPTDHHAQRFGFMGEHTLDRSFGTQDANLVFRARPVHAAINQPEPVMMIQTVVGDRV